MAYNGRIDSGTSRTGSISYQGEGDSFTTAFIAGLTYSVAAKGGSSGSGTLQDPNLSLYDSAGNRLLYDDDINPPNDATPGTNRDAQLTFTIHQTANYTLGVAETGNNATGSYTLTVSAGYASNGNDRVTGTNYRDAVAGMDGNDTISSMGGNDHLFGGNGADRLLGGTGADTLLGQNGNDVLRGQAGYDVLIGGLGADDLYGGSSSDRFVFNSYADSNSTYGVDVIAAGDGAAAFQGAGVNGGDVIDLRPMDANLSVAGNQAFIWSASGAAGTLFLREVNGNTVVNGHVNGDGRVDFQLIIADGSVTANAYGADDFLL